MATGSENYTEAGEGGSSLFKEADKLLGLAEKLQEKCEEYERRVAVYASVGVVVVLSLISAGVYFLLKSPSGARPENLWMGVGSCVYALAFGASLYFLRSRLVRQWARERRALHEIVDMLRELESGIAERTNLSALERAEFRIRLSRFDIGPGW